MMYTLSFVTKNTDKIYIFKNENLKAITVNAYKIDHFLRRTIVVVPRG